MTLHFSFTLKYIQHYDSDVQMSKNKKIQIQEVPQKLYE